MTYILEAKDLRKQYPEKLALRSLNAINAQTSFNALAGTDLSAHLAFQQSATYYHDALRAFYYPCLFHRIAFAHADYAQEPTQTFTSSSETATAVRGLGKLLVSVSVVLAGGLLLFWARSINPR